MKIKLSIILTLLLCLVSCSSPESALQKIGDGRYSEPIAGDLRFTMELVKGNEFSLALISNAEAQAFIDGEEIPQHLDKIYFQKIYIIHPYNRLIRLKTRK